MTAKALGQSKRLATCKPLASAIGSSSRLGPHFEELVFGECPKVFDIIDWNAIRDHLTPLIREDVGLVDLQPPHKD
jgi:hypothetical protein